MQEGESEARHWASYLYDSLQMPQKTGLERDPVDNRATPVWRSSGHTSLQQWQRWFRTYNRQLLQHLQNNLIIWQLQMGRERVAGSDRQSHLTTAMQMTRPNQKLQSVYASAGAGKQLQRRLQTGRVVGGFIKFSESVHVQGCLGFQLGT